jgi:hypothetical protein
MKPGDRVVWLYSSGRSFLSGYKIRKVSAVVVRTCRHRIRIKVRLDGVEKVLNVVPENLASAEQACDRATT